MTRNIGLDIIRAIAITLVVIGHCIQNFSLPNTILDFVAYAFGFFGVELFFVLSGFLIGQIIAKNINKLSDFNFIKTFWMRRWFRTLPAFYLVLILHLLFFNPEGVFYWRHFLFLNNFTQESLNFFPVAWSLSIEEWFYLFVPLFLFVLRKITKRIPVIIIALIFLVLGIFAVRYLYTVQYNPSYDSFIRKNIPIRLDSILIGVVFAFFKVHVQQLFKFFTKNIIFIAAVLVFVLCLMKGNVLIYDLTSIKTIPASIGFTLNSVLLGIFIVWISEQSFTDRFRVSTLNKSVLFISFTSYSIYLYHYSFFKLIIQEESLNLMAVMQIALSTFVILLISWLTFTYFEKPILAYRDKLFRHD